MMFRLASLFLIMMMMGFSQKPQSPLEAIRIESFYKDHPMVQQSLQSHGKITAEISDFLINSSEDINHKLAIINALGMKVSSHANTDTLNVAICKEYQIQSVYQLSNTRANAELMASYAYLMAMESSFDVQKAHDLAQRARRLQPDNQTIEFVYALLNAQMAFGTDYCDLFNSFQKISKKAIPNLNPDVLKLAMDYADLYKSYCE